MAVVESPKGRSATGDKSGNYPSSKKSSSTCITLKWLVQTNYFHTKILLYFKENCSIAKNIPFFKHNWTHEYFIKLLNFSNMLTSP